MTGDDDFPWSEIRRDYEGYELTKPEICARYGLSAWRLNQRRIAEGWAVRAKGWQRKSRAKQDNGAAARQVETDRSAIQQRPKACENNQEPRRGRRGSKVNRRAQLIERLFRAIETELTIIEERMQDKDNRSPTDSERDTRSIGALIKNLEKLTEFDEQCKGTGEDSGAEGGSGIKGITADEADRIRRDLAARIERIIQS